MVASVDLNHHEQSPLYSQQLSNPYNSCILRCCFDIYLTSLYIYIYIYLTSLLYNRQFCAFPRGTVADSLKGFYQSASIHKLICLSTGSNKPYKPFCKSLWSLVLNPAYFRKRQVPMGLVHAPSFFSAGGANPRETNADVSSWPSPTEHTSNSQ